MTNGVPSKYLCTICVRATTHGAAQRDVRTYEIKCDSIETRVYNYYVIPVETHFANDLRFFFFAERGNSLGSRVKMTTRDLKEETFLSELFPFHHGFGVYARLYMSRRIRNNSNNISSDAAHPWCAGPATYRLVGSVKRTNSGVISLDMRTIHF